jgi:hypothetical protein
MAIEAAVFITYIKPNLLCSERGDFYACHALLEIHIWILFLMASI